MLAIALLLPLTAMAAGSNVNKISGDIRIAADQQAGNLNTVSGDVEVGDHAVVGKANSVSGNVLLGRQARAVQLGSVSGDVQLDNGAVVAGNAGSVSGRVRLAQGSRVQGRLDSVSGAITLDNAQVGLGISTSCGDITVGAGSQVEGGILVNRPDPNSCRTYTNDVTEQGAVVTRQGRGDRPVVVIGPHAVVQGVLEFRRPVVLKVSESAQIGTVKGATVERFAGAAP
jgi:hypothetical protein